MGIHLRPSRADDLAYVTALERDPANRDFIGQWSDEEHLAAMAGSGSREHWIIERDGQRAGFLIAYDGREAGNGIYVKRLLVDDKGRGTGQGALGLFLDDACARHGAEFAWLHVRDWNSRAEAVYTKLGMRRYEPGEEEARRWNQVEPRGAAVFRMRIEASEWLRSRAR